MMQSCPHSPVSPVSEAWMSAQAPLALQSHAMPPLVSPRTPHRSQTDHRGSSPSYFGYVPDPSSNPLTPGKARLSKPSVSPKSSSVRSTAASSPRPLPSTSNPSLDLFRRQSDSSAFSLSQGGLPNPQNKSLNSRTQTRPLVSRRLSKQPDGTSSPPGAIATSSSKPDTIQGGEQTTDSSGDSRSPKRLLSPASGIFSHREAESSDTPNEQDPGVHRNLPSTGNEKHLRLSLPPPTPAVPGAQRLGRAETLPASLEVDGPSFVTPQYVVNVLDSSEDGDALLLDLRVSTQYVKARIRGALNLCIPTTLLKRSSYNVQRLAETFKNDMQRNKFEGWMSSKCIIVYDAISSQAKDANNCVNILKKFEAEGYEGNLLILKGGFLDFSRSFSNFVDEKPIGHAASTSTNLSLRSESDNLPPVIGGCPIPNTKNAANPFFGNIRQNMDLIGGVGQMPVKIPAYLPSQAIYDFPKWLRVACNEKDNGKAVSDKFLQIEKREQKRMQEALSTNAVNSTPGASRANKAVRIAGIEKGSKNRYNNIWPFEHSRVKLQGIPSGECDYINANFIKTSLSDRRYVATQGPIPATFVDFWKMVWQRDIRVIVMLTAESEGGQIKAHNYWSGKNYGPLKLEFLSEHKASLELSKIRSHRARPSISKRHSSSLGSIRTGSEKQTAPTSDQPYVIVRKFAVSHQDHPFDRIREITQLHYSNWPDFGAPAHPTHLLGLVEQCDLVVRSTHNASQSRKETTPTERPILVHCSAGCGRTGTFCTVDSVVDMLKRQRSARNKRQGSAMEVGSESHGNSGSDDGEQKDWRYRDDIDLVEKTVEEFRLQRLSMVQSLRQFVLCYESVLEWLAAQAVPTPSTA